MAPTQAPVTLASLEVQVTAAQAAIAVLQKAQAGDAAASALTALQNSITALQKAQAGDAQVSALTATQTALTSLQNVVTALQTAQAGNASAASVTALQTAVTNMQASLTAFVAQIAAEAVRAEGAEATILADEQAETKRAEAEEAVLLADIQALQPVTPPPPPVTPAPTGAITASLTSVAQGTSVTLSYTTENATSASINGTPLAVVASGTMNVTPSATTTYLLTMVGPGGDGTATVSVNVVPPVTPPAPGSLLQPMMTGQLVGSDNPVAIGAVLSADMAMPSGNTYTFTETTVLDDWNDPAGQGVIHFSIGAFTGTVAAADAAVVPFMHIIFARGAASSYAAVFPVFYTLEQPANAQITVAHTGPYTLKVRQGTTPLRTIVVADQWLGSTYLWQSEMLPVINSVASIVAANEIEPYGNMGITPTALEAIAPYINPMDTASLTTYMGETGERPEIDEEPDCCAAFTYSNGSDQTSLNGIFAQCHAMFSVPVWMLSAKGEPIDPLNTNLYTAGAAQSTGDPNYLISTESTVFGAIGSATNPCPWILDNSHWPNSAWLAFCLTRNPFYFLIVQTAMVNWYMKNLWDWPELYAGQTRDVQQGVNFMCQILDVLESLPSVPGWCVNHADYAEEETDQIAWFQKNFVNVATPIPMPPTAGASFTAAGAVTTEDWETDRLGQTLWKWVRRGRTQWKPYAQYITNGAKIRYNGTSGWPPQAGDLYISVYSATGAASRATNPPPAGYSNRSTICIQSADWLTPAEAFQASAAAWNAQAGSQVVDPALPTTQVEPPTWRVLADDTYLCFARNHFAMAQLAQGVGVDPILDSCLAYADAMVHNPTLGGAAPQIEFKNSIVLATG